MHKTTIITFNYIRGTGPSYFNTVCVPVPTVWRVPACAQLIEVTWLYHVTRTTCFVTEGSHFLLQSSGTLFHWTFDHPSSVVDNFLKSQLLFKQVYMLWELFKSELHWTELKCSVLYSQYSQCQCREHQGTAPDIGLSVSIKSTQRGTPLPYNMIWYDMIGKIMWSS